MPDMSDRDAAIALGISRNQLRQWVWMSTLPREQLDAYFADCDAKRKIPSSREVELLARRHAGNQALERERRCPHCGGLLWWEGTR